MTTHTPGTLTPDEARGIIAELDRLEAINAELLAACQWAMRSEHHSACPIPRGEGQTTIAKDDCTCHVKAARTAIAKAQPAAPK